MHIFKAKAVSLTLCVGLLSACGGSPQMESNAAFKRVACDAPLAEAVSVVSGTVGKTFYQYTGDARYTAAGTQRSVSIENLNAHQQRWRVENVTPALGRYSCDDVDAPFIALSNAANGFLIDSAAGDCEVTVTEISSDRIVGHFNANLSNTSGSRQHKVADGCFNVMFADAILDADLDGLSDADDGCPFDASNGCIEQPAHINMCHADDVI